MFVFSVMQCIKNQNKGFSYALIEKYLVSNEKKFNQGRQLAHLKICRWSRNKISHSAPLNENQPASGTFRLTLKISFVGKSQFAESVEYC